ncbi:MAG: hypothetical protein AAF357_03075 [Verrucomicrobiota bacterium]
MKSGSMEEQYEFPPQRTLETGQHQAIAGLSSRQYAIVAWAAFGKTNQEIEIILGLGRNVVERDLSAAISAVGCSSRFEIVQFFHACVLQRSERQDCDDRGLGQPA